MQDLRYPIGEMKMHEFSTTTKNSLIADIKFLPQEIENAVINLDESQINTPYRNGGWTVKQVVHHVADSHINAYTRFKLALTEDNPTIKPYQENEWIKLEDVDLVPVNVSLTLLHSLHFRLYTLLNSLQDEYFKNTVFHPDSKKQMSVWYLLNLYAWHGKHHTAHIKKLRQRMNW